jgi:hypothetical protein
VPEKKEPNEYEPVSGVIEDLAAAIIADHHPHLQGVKVVYAGRTEAAVIQGEPKFAVARKVSGLNAYLAEGSASSFFVIEICEKLFMQLDAPTQKAVLDHVLTRCAVRPASKGLYIRPYAVQEFPEIIHRHGLYNEKVRDLWRLANKHQGALSFDESEEAGPMEQSLKDSHPAEQPVTRQRAGGSKPKTAAAGASA